MKKIFIALLCMCSCLNSFAFEKELVGRYRMSYCQDKRYDVMAVRITKKGKVDYWIYMQADSEYPNDKAFLQVTNKQVDAFKAYLIDCKNHFVEWKKDVDENHSKTNHLYSGKFPKCTFWYEPSGERLKYCTNVFTGLKTLMPEFVVASDGTCAFFIKDAMGNTTFSAHDGDYVYTLRRSFTWAFSSEEEFDAIINLLDKNRK